MRRIVVLAALSALGLRAAAPAAALPGNYFEILQAGIAPVEQRFSQGSPGDLAALEKQPGWRHFPHAALVAAVLYAKQNPLNKRYRDPKMLALAGSIGDVAAASNAAGEFTERGDHHRDLYTWLEAYRLLEKELAPERRAAWRRELEKNLELLAADIASRADRAAYISPFIVTSPNHLSLWSSTLYLGGKVFANPRWVELGGRVMHRFAAEEQAPDGYWGEHDITGPTTGYDYLTVTAVALYAEHSKDPAALAALRRSTTFHKHFTWPDGSPVETVNDRNRYWSEKAWGHFGFTHFPDGRRHAAFLTTRIAAGDSRHGMEELGRLAQNALYYHSGPTAPIPQDMKTSVWRMKQVPAGMRKTGPWVVCLSGLIATPAAGNRFYLDRQGHVSVFHEKTGLIVTGANSKRQPELATFWEKVQGQVYHLPQASRLRMAEAEDRLSLAYGTFFSDLHVPTPGDREMTLNFRVTPKSRREEAFLNLQLVLAPGETLETGAGKRFTIGAEKIDLAPADLGGSIRHRGWTMKLHPAARFSWPCFPHNPYGDKPEGNIRNAVATVSVPLLGDRPSEAQEISFALRVE